MVIRQKPVEIPVLTWKFPLLDKASSRRSYDTERHHIHYLGGHRACLPHFFQDLLRISMRLAPSGPGRISRIDAYANDAYANEKYVAVHGGVGARTYQSRRMSAFGERRHHQTATADSAP